MHRLLPFIFCLLPFALIAQQTKNKNKDTPISSRPNCRLGIAFINYDSSLTLDYPGGIRAFLLDSLKYPPEAMKNFWEGTVLIRLSVDSTGEVYEIELLESSGHQLLDSTAMEVVTIMKSWKPAYYEGRPIGSAIVIPILFKLNEQLKNPEGDRRDRNSE